MRSPPLTRYPSPVYARKSGKVGRTLLCLPAFCSLLSLLLTFGCSRDGNPEVEEATGALPDQVSFNEHIRPLFTEHCTSCHGGVKQAGQLSFVYESKALGRGESGKPAIVPQSPNLSEVMKRVRSSDPGYRMPPASHGEALSAREIALLSQWIKQGARWEEHWAFTPPLEQTPPETANQDWPNSPIDSFILAKLEANGLAPETEEERSRLFRRLSLDLTGLPPTPEQRDAFLADKSENAYENAVERLLASPHFGERWAVMWLDLARYADSLGFERDAQREIWAYRDWVIQSLNEDLPFDQFTLKQLAGDLLPNPAIDDLIATAFQRNTKVNIEGGTDDEEFRVAAVLDRVNTTWQTWMGTTFACVQCHSHPYDPFPHESYYRFMSYYNNTEDYDTWDEFPKLTLSRNHEERGQISRAQLVAEEVEGRYLAPFQELEKTTAWKPLDYETARSSDEVTLSILRSPDGQPYLQTGADAPADTVHTVVAKLASGPLAALRIESLVREGYGPSKPDDPFVLSYLEAYLVNNDGEETKIDLRHAIADQAIQNYGPADSLESCNGRGWGAYPKQLYDRWAVFFPDAPVEVPANAKLKLVLSHWMRHDGAQQPVLRRFRISTDADPAWSELARDPEQVALVAERDTLLASIQDVERTSVPIMRQRDEKYLHETRRFNRGDWLTKEELVEPGLPEILASDAYRKASDRLEMAKWIVSPENPLTARVFANRIWEQLFGIGIVETLEDFGTAGLPPSHPELLDYLAIRFRSDFDWSAKRLIKEIVLSSTYRQSARVSPEKIERDPRNRLLSRGPRNRLSAEMVRDNALVVSGLATLDLYGPPVKPPQPGGIWRNVWNSESWDGAEGPQRYRRAIYTFWKRTTPYPSFQTFDAPSRDFCAPRRIQTNTPLQALVTLNDPVYLECANNLAKVVMEEHEEPQDWVRESLRRALLETPDPQFVKSLTELYQDSLTSLAIEASETDYLGDSDEEAAMTIVANAIMNLDAFLTR